MHHRGVAVAGRVEPHQGDPFPEVRRGEKAIDQFLVGGRGVVGSEGSDFLEGGGESGEVKTEPANQGGAIRLGRRLQALPGELGSDKGIDRGSGIGPGGNVRFSRGDKGPVLRPVRAILDPFPQEILLAVGERFLCLGRRHQFIGIGGNDPFPGVA